MPDGVRPGGGVRTRARGRPKRQTALAVVPHNKPRVISDGIISKVIHQLKGGRQMFMSLARYAPTIDPLCAPVIEAWDKLTDEAKRRLDFDTLCKKTGIDPFHFISVVNEAAMKYRNNMTLLAACLSLPDVVQKSIEVALTDGGVSDRKMLFQHSGFLPVPAGATFVNTFQAKIEQNNSINEQAATLASFEKTIELVDDV